MRFWVRSCIFYCFMSSLKRHITEFSLQGLFSLCLYWSSNLFTFLFQLNPLRFTERRKPQDIQNINQKFDPNKFNFTKISKQEILLHPVGSHWSASKPVTPSSKSLSDVLKHVSIIFNIKLSYYMLICECSNENHILCWMKYPCVTCIFCWK